MSNVLRPVRVGASISRTPTSSRGENSLDLPRHLGDLGHAVDLTEDALGTVVGQYRRGLGVVGREARLHGLGVVVGSADEIDRAAVVALARHFRSIVAIVIAGSRSEEHTSEL